MKRWLSVVSKTKRNLVVLVDFDSGIDKPHVGRYARELGSSGSEDSCTSKESVCNLHVGCC
jgi:hypothetical protein